MEFLHMMRYMERAWSQTAPVLRRRYVGSSILRTFTETSLFSYLLNGDESRAVGCVVDLIQLIFGHSCV